MTTLAATPSASAPATPAAPTARSSGKYELGPEDFIKMMVTQLQNQDPLEPAKNEQLLSQMSQIGQLQGSTDLQRSLKTLVLQNNLSSAGNLIGKQVEGLDGAGDPVDGVVRTVQVKEGAVWLELESGQTVNLSNVTQIAPAAGTATGTATAAPAA